MSTEIQIVRKKLHPSAITTADPTLPPIGYLEKLKIRLKKIDFLEPLILAVCVFFSIAIILMLITWAFPVTLPVLSLGTGIYFGFSLLGTYLPISFSTILLWGLGIINTFAVCLALITKLKNPEDEDGDDDGEFENLDNSTRSNSCNSRSEYLAPETNLQWHKWAEEIELQPLISRKVEADDDDNGDVLLEPCYIPFGK